VVIVVSDSCRMESEGGAGVIGGVGGLIAGTECGGAVRRE
jgi:hypothetical protein